MPVRALIFDMDGTMIIRMGHHRLSWIELRAATPSTSKSTI
jgi:beta-phosphoglucomutase-like phosphatase (HAD superfamily)